ncbi:MAG: C25 family cysteine peptidase, partial [Patescibacteria group bacterium]
QAAFLQFAKGKIFLQVESRGEAFYVYPDDKKRYYLGRPADAFAVMRQLGLGVRHDFMLQSTVFPTHVVGKILIDVDDRGKAYYISPSDRQAYYLGRPADAFRVMRSQGLGITNGALARIPLAESSRTPPAIAPARSAVVAAVTRTGCQYANPACPADQECRNNLCILKTGCFYNNPSCPTNEQCLDGVCRSKYGCQFRNPDCASNQECRDNVCVLKAGCFFNNPACPSNAECLSNACVLKSGCAYNNPACQTGRQCVNNVCVAAQSGCQYGNPPCAANQECRNNYCVFKSGCAYNNPACSQNEDCVNNVCVPITANQSCTDAECDAVLPNFTIITRPMFVSALQPFVAWKQGQGLSVGIVTADYLDGAITGANVSAKIKNYIQQKTSVGKYFLLVGTTRVKAGFKFDVQSSQEILTNIDGMYDLSKPWNVPSGYVFLNSEGSGSTGSMMLSDLYYSDPTNWDQDGNGVNDAKNWGEKFGLTAMIGRWPTMTADEVTSIAAKTMQVQAVTKIEHWVNDTWKPSYYDEPGLSYCDSLPQFWLDKGAVDVFCSMRRFILPERYHLTFVAAADAAAGNSEFVNFFTATDRIVYANFHGSHNSIEGLTSREVGNFTHIIPLYMPQSCSMVHYYLTSSEDALSSALMNAAKGPAAVVVPPNNFVFLKGLSEGKTIGEAFYPREATWQLNRWYVTLFGDPSLRVYDAP